MKAVNYGFAAIMILLALIAIFPSGSFVHMGGGDIGSAALPQGVAILTILLSCLLIGFTKYEKAVDKELHEIFTKAKIIRVAKTISLFIVYLVVMSFIGFLPATILFLVVFLRMMVIGWMKTIVVSLAAAVTVYYVFHVIFSVQLPTGIW